MPRSEQEVQQLLRNVASSAEEAPWDLTGEELRTQATTRWYRRVDPKAIAVLVAAAALIIVVFSVVGGNTEHRKQASGTAATTTTTPEAQTVAVPAVTGMTQVAAINLLGAAGLIAGEIVPIASSVFPAGIIVASSPSPGTAVAPGSSVNLSVSSGPRETLGSSPPASVPTTVPATPATTTPTTSAVAPAGTLHAVVTSVTATSLPYNPELTTGGIPAEQVNFSITGIFTGAIECTATVIQGGETMGSQAESIGLPVSSTRSTTVSETINVSPLSVSPFDGSPSDARVTCTS